MSPDAAQEAARRLRVALLDHGVRKVSIELMPGRPVASGSNCLNTRFIGEMSHHTGWPVVRADTIVGAVQAGPIRPSRSAV
jgi:hypothetical protein